MTKKGLRTGEQISTISSMAIKNASNRFFHKPVHHSVTIFFFGAGTIAIIITLCVIILTHKAVRNQQETTQQQPLSVISTSPDMVTSQTPVPQSSEESNGGMYGTAPTINKDLIKQYISPSQTVSGWQTYTDPQNRFSFSFPSDWIISYIPSTDKNPRIVLHALHIYPQLYFMTVSSPQNYFPPVGRNVTKVQMDTVIYGGKNFTEHKPLDTNSNLLERDLYPTENTSGMLGFNVIVSAGATGYQATTPTIEKILSSLQFNE